MRNNDTKITCATNLSGIGTEILWSLDGTFIVARFVDGKFVRVNKDEANDSETVVIVYE